MGTGNDGSCNRVSGSCLLCFISLPCSPSAFTGLYERIVLVYCIFTRVGSSIKLKMGHANIWFSHPRKYGQGSRSW